MDNVTHSLVGWTLGQTGLKRKTRKGLAALILGANAPDIDVFLGWVPWAPLATHRGFAHSLVGGVLILPLALAALLWLYDRWQVRRGATFKSGLKMRFWWLVALSYVGCLTHPFLDWQTSYAIQLFTPLDNRWYHADTLFILDIWVWLGLGFAIWLSRRREKRGEGDWRRPAIVALAALLAYIGGNSLITVRAEALVAQTLPDGAPEVIVASPPPVLFWRRNLIWRHGHDIRRAEYAPLMSWGRLRAVSQPVPDGMDDPLTRRALMAPQVAHFRRWSILPMAQVSLGRCRATVAFEDARFGTRPGASRLLGQSVSLPTGAPGC